MAGPQVRGTKRSLYRHYVSDLQVSMDGRGRRAAGHAPYVEFKLVQVGLVRHGIISRRRAVNRQPGILARREGERRTVNGKAQASDVVRDVLDRRHATPHSAEGMVGLLVLAKPRDGRVTVR